MKRKKHIGLVVVAVGLLVAAFGVYTAPASPSALADDDEDDTLAIKVEDAVITLNVPMMPGRATYFVIVGNITEVNGEEASGKFYCKGVFVNPGALGLPALADGTPSADG